jgi:hypothetical protein
MSISQEEIGNQIKNLEQKELLVKQLLFHIFLHLSINLIKLE